MIYRETPIHDYCDPGGLESASYFGATDPLLHPDQPGSNLQELVQQSWNVLRTTEDVYDVDRPCCCCGRTKIGMYPLAQGNSASGMYRNDRVARPLKVRGYSMTRTFGLPAQSDHGDAARIADQLRELSTARGHPSDCPVVLRAAAHCSADEHYAASPCDLDRQGGRNRGSRNI